MWNFWRFDSTGASLFIFPTFSGDNGNFASDLFSLRSWMLGGTGGGGGGGACSTFMSIEIWSMLPFALNKPISLMYRLWPNWGLC
jgi:hypothetical protein